MPAQGHEKRFALVGCGCGMVRGASSWVLVHVQPRSCFICSMFMPLAPTCFCLCHCLTLVDVTDVTSISSLFAFTFLHPLSILPYDLTPFCARSGATAWETQSSSCFDKCHLGSMVVKSLHKHSCGQENANRSMVCWSMSLFAPCAWMLPKRVPAANWQWFLHLSCPGVRAEELVGWKSWIIMPISGKTAGNSGCDFWSPDLGSSFRYPISVQGTAAALVLGKQLERAVSFPDLECLVKVGAFIGN